MNANERVKLNQLSARVIGAAFRVSNTLGCGFLEKVYENALAAELHRDGLKAVQQGAVTIRYEQEIVGEYFADLLVEDQIIVELKVVRSFEPIHEAQCLNYLRASGLPLCLLLNFAHPRVAVRRIINA